MLKIQLGTAVVKEAKGGKLVDPSAVHAECQDMSMMAQEAVVVLTINARNRMIWRHLVTLGLADTSLVHPREVFRPAILDGAVSIILVHNHPTGEVDPSAEDFKVTRQIIEAGKVMGIKLLDHVIIGRGEKPFNSIRESGMVTFS
jgi:DNA repair protein RadC